MKESKQTSVTDLSRPWFPALFLLLMLFVALFISSCSMPWNNTEEPVACGTVLSTEALSNKADNAKAAGICFFQAYQKCQAASLVYVDQDKEIQQDQEKTLRTFEIDGQTCKVSEVVQVNARSLTYACTKMEGVRGGAGALRFVGCGSDGTFSLLMNGAIQ